LGSAEAALEERISKIRIESGFLKRLASGFRKEATPAEAAVWEQLKARRLNGLRFRRQHVLHGYVIDFYCHERRLCIELDGAPHLESGQAAKDKNRDADLILRGYRVLRMMNEDVLRDIPIFRERVQEAAFSPPCVPPL